MPTTLMKKLEFLECIPKKDLADFVRSYSHVSQGKLIESLDAEELEGVVFALFTYSIFSNEQFRILFFCNANEDKVFELAFRLGKNAQGTRYKLAIELASFQWSFGSKIVQEVKRLFNIPREYLPHRSSTAEAIDDLLVRETLTSLFDYQEEVLEKVHNFLSSDEDKRALIQLPTGSGKTRTATESITKFISNNPDEDYLLVWMAHTEELCEQAVESFSKIWREHGPKDAKIGRFWGSYNAIKEIDDIDILVAGYQKIVRLEEDDIESFFGTRTVILIVDEAHKALAKTVKRFLLSVLEINELAKLIGLTATPGRSFSNDLENKKLAKLFNQNLITAESLGDEPISRLQERGILADMAPITRMEYQNEMGFDLSVDDVGDFSAKTLSRLALDEARNDFIVEIIKKEIKLGHRVLVFCCNVEHSKLLAVRLAAERVNALSVDCTLRRKDRKNAIDSFKRGKVKVLTNFGILTTGYDDPTLETILITRPTQSIVLYSQMLGRGLRGKAMGGSNECRIIDISDSAASYGGADSIYEYFTRNWQ